MILYILPRGGTISKLALKEFENFNDKPVPMILDGNTEFNISLNTKDGRTLNTRDFYFTYEIIEKDDAFLVSMKSNLSETQYFIFEYLFPKNGYLFSLSFKGYGVDQILDQNQSPKISWKTDVFRNSRSIDYENRYTEFTFGYEDDRVDYLSLSGEDSETRDGVRWISYRQHFFSAILIPQETISVADIKSKDLSGEEYLNKKFTKRFETDMNYLKKQER